VKDNPLSFLIAPFDLQIHANQHSSRAGNKQYILTVRYPEEKKLWTQNIKRQILKNHHTAIPLQAQQSIMNMDRIKLGERSRLLLVNEDGFCSISITRVCETSATEAIGSCSIPSRVKSTH